MNKIFFCLLLVIITALGSCHKVTVGYLITEYAGYVPDTLGIKSVLSDTAHTEGPDPLYEMYLGLGFTPQEIADYFGIYPTKIVAGEDYFRNKYGVPWVSTPIQGLQGTNPIKITVKNIVTNTGDAGKLQNYISIRGDGTMTIPAQADLPPGEYKISLNFQNEGYTKSIDNAFTIFVR